MAVDAKFESFDQVAAEQWAHSGAGKVRAGDPVQDSEWVGGSLALHFYSQETEGMGSDGQRVVGCQVE